MGGSRDLVVASPTQPCSGRVTENGCHSSSVAVRWVCHGIQSSQLQRSREVGVSRDQVTAPGTSGYPWAAEGRGVANVDNFFPFFLSLLF